MADPNWPSPTPRDEVFDRVVSRGKRIRLVNRTLIGAAVAGAVTVAGVGMWLGTSGAVDLVGDDGAPATIVDPSAGNVSYFACPNRDALGTLSPGDRVFLTGQDGSGDWVEVRSPAGSAPVWVRAELVAPDDTVDLPEVECDQGAAPTDPTDTTTTVPGATTTSTEPGATTTTEPGATTTTTDDSTTTSTPTTPTTRPNTGSTTPQTTPQTTTPATPAPSIGPLSRSQTTIVEQGAGCPGAASSTISSSISGATSATLSWNVGPQPRSKAMQRQGSNFSAVLGPFGLDAVDSPPNSTTVTVTITATGPGGTRTRTTTVSLVDCYFG